MPALHLLGRIPSQEPLLPLQSPSEKPYHSLLMAQFITPLHFRKSRQHTILLAFLSFILLSSYVFLIHCPDANASLPLRNPEVKPLSAQLTLTDEYIRKPNLVAVPQPVDNQIRLTTAQELAAVSSFLASLPQNQLPSSIDPLSPIDPQLVLDFNTRTSRASQEVQTMVEDVWSRNPVFLYSKHYSSASREIKAILHDLNLVTPPTIIDVDTRDDANVLIPLLKRLTSTDALPILIVGGKVVGSSRDILQMDHDGTLQRLIIESGVLVNRAKQKKRKH